MTNQEINLGNEGKHAEQQASSSETQTNIIPAREIIASLPEQPTDEQVSDLITAMTDTSFRELSDTSSDVRESLWERRDSADAEYRRLTSPDNLAMPNEASAPLLLSLLIQRDTAQRDVLNMDIANNEYNAQMHRLDIRGGQVGPSVSREEAQNAAAAARGAYVRYGEVAFRASPQVFRESAARRLQAQTAPSIPPMTTVVSRMAR